MPAAPSFTAGRDNGLLHLPRREHIQKVDPSDPLDYYYTPVVSWFYRQRLQMALDLLGPGPYESVLEAGYGSGILLPSLTSRASRLAAMDLHRRTDLVRPMLAAERAQAALSVGTVCSLAYASASFDALVCVSTLEHLHAPDLEAAVREFHRVLRPNGCAVIGVPASGQLMELLFHAIGFAEIDEHHVSTHEDIEAALRRQFTLEAERRLPAIAPHAAALYTVFRCRAN